jgi:hypothetical protein
MHWLGTVRLLHRKASEDAINVDYFDGKRDDGSAAPKLVGYHCVHLGLSLELLSVGVEFHCNRAVAFYMKDVSFAALAEKLSELKAPS